MSIRAIRKLEQAWSSDSRWDGIIRPCSAKDVMCIRGALAIEYTLARQGASRLWNLIQDACVDALSPTAWTLSLMRISSAAKHRPRISTTPGSSRKPSMKSIRENFPLTIERLHLTGNATWRTHCPGLAGGTRGYGVQVPVCYAGRFPYPQ